MNDDIWIAQRSLIEPEKLHALGVVTFFWNSAEIGLFNLFEAVANLPAKQARILIYDLQVPAIIDRIKYLLPQSGLSKDVVDSVEYALKIFDVCRINRNQLTHFAPVGMATGIEFWRIKGHEWTRNVVPNSVDDIRRVAEEITTCNNFVAVVAMHIYEIRTGGEQRSLPDRPPLPERLWKPPSPSPRHPSS